MNRYFSSSILLACFIFLFLTGCSDDDYPGRNQFVVAFKNPSESFSDTETLKEIELSFSHPAPENGSVEIRFETALEYGVNEDFLTDPPGANGIIHLPITQGSSTASIQVEKLQNIPPGENNTIIFSIQSVTMPGFSALSQGNTQVLVSLSESAALGGTVNPDVGGPNQPNQVYFCLRTKTETKIRRDIWDLSFYSGDDFHVRLNGSLYMFAGALEFTDIDVVRESDVSSLKPNMNFLMEGSDIYVDHPDGNPERYVISNISENNENNPVYLLKMGNEIGTETPEPGGVAIAGAERGWKKIRILRRDDNYLLQYADVDSQTHREVTIPKTQGFNFTFFNFESGSAVSVEPEQSKWDLNFTVATEIEEFPEGGMTAYGYSDYVQTNMLAGIQAYRVLSDAISYENFSSADIDETQFSNDQRIIGSSWRNTLPPDRSVFTNIFYIVRDAEANYYKIRFTALENENGIRGYPEFEYQILD